MVEGKIATRRSRNFYTNQIKNSAKIEIWKTVKQKTNNWTEWRFEVVDQPTGSKKKKKNILYAFDFRPNRMHVQYCFVNTLQPDKHNLR